MHAEDHSNKPPVSNQAVGGALPVGTELLRGQFRIERFLNSGGFGMTYLARNSLDRKVVIKECFPSFLCFRQENRVVARSKENSTDFKSLVDLFRAEARALARLDHPNIVGVHEVFDDNNTAYMALDFLEGKDLQEVVETEPDRLGPMELRRILVSVLGAVSYIHEKGVLHRDIAPDNILINRQNDPVLIDFGSARESTTRVGCVETRLQSVKDGYSPHEFYSRKLNHSAASDLYALGATFHFAIRGEAPPSSQFRVAALIEKQKDPYRPLKGDTGRFDSRILESIDRSLAIVPKDRIQSARDWLLAIDDDSRKVAALEKARSDERIEQIVRDLVFETNAAMQEQEQEQKQAETEQRLVEQAAAAERDRKKAETAKRIAEAEAAEAESIVTMAEDGAGPSSPAQEVDDRDVDNDSADDAAVGEPIDSHGGSDAHAVQSAPAKAPRRVAKNRPPAFDTYQPVNVAEAGFAQPEKKRRRFSFDINWHLPPLFVSEATQLVGKVE